MNTWVDFTRRSDPAHRDGTVLLKNNLARHGFPDVFCFWTKAPAIVASLYANAIRQMQTAGVLVLAQVTLNNYGRPLEAGVNPAFQDLSMLNQLLGPNAIRLRFDPIIAGFTSPAHFKQTVAQAVRHNINRITINFLVSQYKNCQSALNNAGILFHNPTIPERVAIIKKLRDLTPNSIDLAACAESVALCRQLSFLKPAACADPAWAVLLRPDLRYFHKHGSRKDCGCVYTDDWGVYRSRGGYRCPHQCLYCYAK